MVIGGLSVAITIAVAAATMADECPPSAVGAISNGQRGGTLKWVAHPDAHRYPVRQASGVEPAPGPILDSPVKTAWRQSDPLADPFGDANGPPRALPVPPRPLPDEPRSLADEPGALPEEPRTLPGTLAPKTPGAVTRPAESAVPAPPLDRAYSQFERGPLPPPDAGAGPNQPESKCPTKGEPYWEEFFKTMKGLSTDIAATDGDFPPECELGREQYQPRCWATTHFMWKAAGLCHKPLYFEDKHLERYGHSAHPWLQPVLSGAHFFVTLPVLPYKMGLEPPGECIYTLGYYRPGNCAPHMLDPIPLSVRAALFESGAWVAGAAIIP